MKPPNPDSAENLAQVLELWRKIERGEITTAHLKWFNGLDKKARDACLAGKLTSSTPLKIVETVPDSKFKLIANLGVITVPKSYRHSTYIGTFIEKNRWKFSYIDDTILYQNSEQVTTQLSPGDRLNVRVFGVSDKFVSYKGYMEFLNRQNCVFVGAQGAALVFMQKIGLLKKLARQLAVRDYKGGYYHAFLSPDNLKALYKVGGRRYVAGLGYGDEGWNFDLLGARFKCGDDPSFLCFNWVNDETTPANDNAKTESPEEREKAKKDWEL